jgi:hypothetical protein
MKRSAPEMLRRLNAADRLECLLAKRAFEGEMLLANGARFQVSFKFDLRCRVELSVDECAKMTSH